MNRRNTDNFFSQCFCDLLEGIAPYGRTEARYPAECKDHRISEGEGAHGWFKRLIDGPLEGRVERCAVEQNMAVVAHLEYAGEKITYANIQVLVAEADLESFYCDDAIRSWYFRLDYDLRCLGPLFKEPLPHIHCLPEGEPRFHCPAPTGNAVVDFFDFIYRNFHPEKWRDWAHRAYAASLLQGEKDLFEPIKAAFATNEHEALMTKYSDGLIALKRVCRNLKDDVFRHRIDPELADALSYDRP
jgi:hypothetical protein